MLTSRELPRVASHLAGVKSYDVSGMEGKRKKKEKEQETQGRKITVEKGDDTSTQLQLYYFIRAWAFDSFLSENCWLVWHCLASYRGYRGNGKPKSRWRNLLFGSRVDGNVGFLDNFVN